MEHEPISLTNPDLVPFWVMIGIGLGIAALGIIMSIEPFWSRRLNIPAEPPALTQEQQDAQACAEVRERRAEARRARTAQRKQVRERRRAASARAYQEALRRQELVRREAALERGEDLRRREEDVRRREEALAASQASAALPVIDLSSWGIGLQAHPLVDGQDLEQTPPPVLPIRFSKSGMKMSETSGALSHGQAITGRTPHPSAPRGTRA